MQAGGSYNSTRVAAFRPHRQRNYPRICMLPSVGIPELIIILTIALIIFGPRKLPELGRSLGRSLNEFKRASHELKNTLDDEIRIEDQKSAERQRAPEEAAAPAATVEDSVPRTKSDQA